MRVDGFVNLRNTKKLFHSSFASLNSNSSSINSTKLCLHRLNGGRVFKIEIILERGGGGRGADSIKKKKKSDILRDKNKNEKNKKMFFQRKLQNERP